jgi:hypothetical protein
LGSGLLGIFAIKTSGQQLQSLIFVAQVAPEEGNRD